MSERPVSERSRLPTADDAVLMGLAAEAAKIRVDLDPHLPAGFAAGALAAGIKPSGRPDLAVVSVTTAGPAAAAAAFTQNLVQAAPVRLSREHLAATVSREPVSCTGGASADSPGAAPPGASRAAPPEVGRTTPAAAPGAEHRLPHGRARAVLVTSGCANAATGPAGDADQEAIARQLAETVGCSPEETLLASTGLIGTRLPVERVAAGIAALVPGGLAAEDASLAGVARAMMTTDRRLKAASVRLDLPEGSTLRPVWVSGVVKGVGMLHPGMATMIALLLTDATVAPATLAALLRPAVALSFDQLTVDGDTSTNDTVFALASGAAGTDCVAADSPAAARLGAALAAVCRSLARQQAADGEGATCLITCRVAGAADLADARAVSRAVVGSSLLKAAVHGRDPNWGRVAAAAGAARRPDGSAVALAVESLRIALCGSPVFAGAPLAFDAAAVSAQMAAPEVTIDLDLGLGGAAAEAWGCDLTEAYVRENAEYST
ncbi:MAG: bifunctional glutamate N-acetyltransferase/amino-acid acetyltransferase ArgJ [Candidatus Limnocylindrales bacterium]